MRDKIHLDVEVPSRLSDWVLLAIRDAEKLAEYRPYEIVFNMGCWLQVSGPICYVCLAGAVMLSHMPERLSSESRRFFPSDFNGHDRMADKLGALDSVRCGALLAAIEEFYPEDSDHLAQANQIPELRQIAASLRHFDAEFVTEIKRRAKLLAEHGF